jgi:phytoene dehydrogenase-like protein
MRRGASIAVLGGGVSGLTFAASMRERGFARVTVFERAAAVGGKACTVEIDGRPHDLGATMGVPLDYRRVLRFSRAAGLETARFPVERHYSLARGRAVALNRWHELPRVWAEGARYLALHAASWRGVDGSGLERAPARLHRPWAELVERHRLHTVNRRLLAYRTGYGYGFDDEVPALMYANLFRPQVFLGLALRPAFLWRRGTQPIWQAVARGLDVRTSTAIERVERDDAGVTVHTHAGAQRFDALVVTVNPRDALDVLDARDDERAWFSQVRTYPYATFACEVRGLDAGRAAVGYLDENMARERAGRPMAWVKRHADHDVCVFHLFAPPELSDDQCAGRIAADVARLGGHLVRVRASRRWQFFPHFSTAFFESGGLGQIDRWQGQRRTWLIGEVLSFATMARVADLAARLARRLA